MTTAQQENDSGKTSCKSIAIYYGKEISIGLRIMNDEKSSYKEHRVDALAPYADEGRGKLRKATGSRKQAPIRRYPNGETRQVKSLSP